MWIDAGGTACLDPPEVQVSDVGDVWTQVTLSLRSQFAESVWFSTFQDLTPLESDAATLRLMAPSAYVRDRILTRYLPLVTEALQDVNEGQRSVEIDAASGDAGPEPDDADDQRSGGPMHRSHDYNSRTPAATTAGTWAATVVGTSTAGDERGTNRGDRSLLDEAGLNPRYTFETFVKGASNQFALAAALRVAETRRAATTRCSSTARPAWARPTCSTPSGTTSTPNYQHHEVRYVSTETFMNEYVDAIRQNTTVFAAPALSLDRRAVDRRHPVHRRQGGAAGRVLPHVQLLARGEQAGRHLLPGSPRPCERSTP